MKDLFLLESGNIHLPQSYYENNLINNWTGRLLERSCHGNKMSNFSGPNCFPLQWIYQSDPQVKENSLNEITNKILSETSINLFHEEASVMPNMPEGS